MPRFVQLRTNEALSNRRHKSVLLKAAEQRLRPRLIAAAVAVLACASLAWWHAQAAPRPAPFARDAERIVADVDWSEDACPRTYVYALPRTLSDWAPGDASPDDGVDANANLLEVLVAALQARCSTKSPADAELFLIPVLPRAKHWSDWMRRCDKLAKLGARDWRRALPHLNMETARRHVFVFPRVAYAPRCAGWWAAPLVVPEFAEVVRVSVGGVHTASTRRLDGVTGTPSPRPTHRGTRVARAGYEEFAGAFQRAKTKRLSARQRAHPEALVPRLVSAPYAARHVQPPGAAARRYLWAYAATPHGSENAKNLRLALQRACAASNDCADGRRGDAARHQRNATFCVEPPGLTPGRASIVTALLAGCIPVLFAPEQDRLWPLHWGGWRDASRVMLDMRRATAEPSYVGDALRAIPASAVDAMRATIHKRAGAFRYSLEDVRGDAVHVLLRGVAAAA